VRPEVRVEPARETGTSGQGEGERRIYAADDTDIFVDVDSLFDRIAWVLTKYTKQILRAAEPLELMRDREWRCREAAVAERRMDGAA